MFRLEWNHYIRKNHLWILVVLFFVCKLISLRCETVYVDTHVWKHAKYENFFQSYEGKMTLAKQNRLPEADEVIRQYLNYVDKDPSRHYLVNEVGWDAWIGNEKSDLMLLGFIVFFCACLVAGDYESGVHPFKYTSGAQKNRLYLCQQGLFALFSLLLIIMSFAEEWVYYAVRYGLSGYRFPVQSLWTFERSPYELTIWQTCIWIHLVKALAILFLGELTLLAGIYLKKIWLIFAAAMAVPVVPYMLVNREQIRYYIQPLGLLLGNGYFRGKFLPTQYDMVEISEPVGHIPGWYLPTVILITAGLTAGVLVALFRRKAGEHGRWLWRNRAGFVLALCQFVVVAGLCGLLVSDSSPKQEQSHAVFYASQSYGDGDIIYRKNDKGEWIADDLKTGQVEKMRRDVFPEGDCVAIYADDRYLYEYIRTEYGEVSIYRVDKQDFTPILLYQETSGQRVYQYTSKYLGLLNVHNLKNTSSEQWDDETIQSFWVDGHRIFLESQSGVRMVDYRTKKSDKLTGKHYQIQSATYRDGTLYYMDRKGHVIRVDVRTQRAEYLDIPRCWSLGLAGEELCFVTTDWKLGIYREEESVLVDGITCADTSPAIGRGNTLYCIGEDHTVLAVDLKTLQHRAVECYDESGRKTTDPVYNVRIYPSGAAELYIGTEGEDYEWVMVEMKE